MFDMAEVLKEERDNFIKDKERLSEQEMKEKIKKDLIRAGILNKKGKLKRLPIR